MRTLTQQQFWDWLRSSLPHEADSGAVVVTLESPTAAESRTSTFDADAFTLLEPLPCVVVGVSPESDGAVPQWCDVMVNEAELPAVLATLRRSPRAAIAFALLLRGQANRSVAAALVAESATYSMLQAGPEFTAWRQSRPIQAREATRPTVLLERDGAELRITLHRPHVLNALDRHMRDELFDALAVARADITIRRVTIAGAGRAFSSGGDLDEFGSRTDPASAHLTRLARSPSLMLHTLADRVEARLHGAAIGSGIEMPAFARRVVAHPDTRIALPELAMGLIPGAGGTVSLPRRIGRHRTAWLALTGAAIDARRALEWGLVDALDPTLSPPRLESGEAT